jgi:hypothetical protein
MNHSGNLVTGLLQVLDEGGIHSIAEIARRLGAGEGLIVAIAEELQRRGLLTPLNDNCGTGCRGCAMSGACAAPGQASSGFGMMALTAKGRRWAQNRYVDTMGN